ncbi:MAG: glycosyltransferase [Candidatus Korobacteraceae bacterium]|jgi:glycosyltransferase involved in cell wall biosynthesis
MHQAMAPTVSVIIPTFNRSALLPKAIESVLAQTYTDYELIVIDDGSTDDTHERLKPYMERIRYFYQDNRGASAAQNKGIEVAKGKWISILGSDDVWLPTKLERQLKALATFGSDFAACFTDCVYVGHPDLWLSAFERAGLKANSEFGQLHDPTGYILRNYSPICPQSLMVLRSLVKELEGFDEAIGVSEDTDLIFRLALKTKLCFVAAPLVRIDQTPSRPRLSDSLGRKNDLLYAWFEYRYRKWLGMRELADCGTRQTIQDQLCALYYDWTTAKLRQLRLAGAIEKINEIRCMGHSYRAIFLVLLSRATRKLSRTLRERATCD